MAHVKEIPMNANTPRIIARVDFNTHIETLNNDGVVNIHK